MLFFPLYDVLIGDRLKQNNAPPKQIGLVDVSISSYICLTKGHWAESGKGVEQSTKTSTTVSFRNHRKDCDRRGGPEYWDRALVLSELPVFWLWA